MTRMMIKGIIKAHRADWGVVEAESGEEALVISEGMMIDVMTLDLNMPGMDGITLGIEMRRRYPEALIALLTSDLQESIQESAKEAQMVFVPKPITEGRIMAFIDRVP
ncbi:MAG: response regulator [Candidatus Polarisedimenticolaceae bacterium]|nr:response regulator [Candidatus Polarisedimenticolaceae bacterium]